MIGMRDQRNFTVRTEKKLKFKLITDMYCGQRHPIEHWETIRRSA